MPAKKTAESFLEMLDKSGLVENDRVSRLISRFKDEGVDLRDSSAIAEALVTDGATHPLASGQVAAWQAQRLLSRQIPVAVAPGHRWDEFRLSG